MRLLGALPLMYQPADRRLPRGRRHPRRCDRPRVRGQSFESFLNERIFEPFDMRGSTRTLGWPSVETMTTDDDHRP
jgi:hypothetical protein